MTSHDSHPGEEIYWERASISGNETVVSFLHIGTVVWYEIPTYGLQEYERSELARGVYHRKHDTKPTLNPSKTI